MKDIIISNAIEPMEKQKQILLDYFIKWKGDYEQTDDVCIIGITIF